MLKGDKNARRKSKTPAYSATQRTENPFVLEYVAARADARTIVAQAVRIRSRIRRLRPIVAVAASIVHART